MNDLDFPLRSPALYNPHLLSKEELVGLFSARQALLDELLEDVRSTPPGKSAQHHLVVGQRGMGKTMLLRRLQFAVEDDPDLCKIWLALSFPEEQYNVATLSDFWLNCIDALSDTLERLGPSQSFEEAEEVVRTLDETVEALRNIPEEERSRRALELLTHATSKLDRRFILLVDNADLVLDRIDEQEWELREVLSSKPEVTFLGASSAAIESTYEYGKAFYDFFRIHDLSGLSVEETRSLLLQYAQAQGHEKVRRIVEEETGRLRTLHTLTGGNPRTLVLLFNIFVQGPDGDVRSDLEQLLDQCTPLYKARFEELSPQAQQVVDALALHWDPVSAGELAEKLRLQVNAVSAQLNRLEKQGIVEKVPYEPASKTGFQVAERFFNIWYLMRASRRIRRRLVWLVEFLRMVYSQEELRTKAQSHLRRLGELDPDLRLRHAEFSFALASAFDEGSLRGALERSALQVLMGQEDLREQLRDLIDLEGADPGLKTRAEYLERFEALQVRLDELVQEGVIPSEADVVARILRAPLRLQEKERIVDELQEAGAERVREIDEMMARSEDSFLRAIGAKEAIQQLLGAIDAGRMTAFDDIEGAKLVETTSEVRGLVAIAAAARVRHAEDDEALGSLEVALRDATSPYPWLIWLHNKHGIELPVQRTKAVLEDIMGLAPNEKILKMLAFSLSSMSPQLAEEIMRYLLEKNSEDSGVWNNLALVLWRQGKVAESEKAFRHAIEAKPEAPIWTNFGDLLRSQGRFKEAEDAIQRALEINPGLWAGWFNLAILFEEQHRLEEAKYALRRAAELEPDQVEVWNHLAGILRTEGHLVEAEATLQRALAVDPEHEAYWHNLALLFQDQRRMEEAEEAFRKVVELDPENGEAWNELARFLGGQGRFEEAEAASRKASDLEPANAQYLELLGRLLYNQERLDEAEMVLNRALELEPQNARAWKSLGDLLDARDDSIGAEDAYRKASEQLQEAKLALGMLLQKQGRLNEAEEFYLQWSEDSSQDTLGHLLLATLREEQGRVSEAKKLYRRAIDEGIEGPALKNSVAWSLFQLDDYLIEAERLARESASEASQPEHSHTLACILVHNGKWIEALEPARVFLRAWASDVPEDLWPDVLIFFRESVKAGKVREATELLDELDLGERWRPLREALEVVALDNPRYLRRLAPEIRQPAEKILEELTAPREETD